ncbi:MAG TPA: leucine-rich repeat domain-containing protein [Candidatus Coproplasma excrementipullorum]|nr:leucine-rich repeat domain-containing protein [Candidatus Coproplasma excrementipullorum]
MIDKVKVDGQTYNNVDRIRAMDATTGEYTDFLDTSAATATAADIVAGKIAYGGGQQLVGTHTGAVPNDLDGMVDGTLTSFTMPSGKNLIFAYRFQNFTALSSVDLGGVATVQQYAFDGCTAVSGIVIPSTLTTIGNYAFRNLGKNSGSTFAYASQSAETTVGDYAFYGAAVNALTGSFATIGDYSFATCSLLTSVEITADSIGDYAFQSCTSLTDIDIDCGSIGTYAFNGSAATDITAKINGGIGNYAFYNQINVASISISADSNITSLGSCAFSRFGSNRASPESNVIEFDFRNSSFPTVNSYAFGGDSSSSSYRNKYMKIRLPSSVATISANAFRYTDHCDFYFYKSTPPTLSATTCWQNATNYKIFVPFGSINAYKTATNWTEEADNIVGFAEAGTFTQGQTLPVLGAEGYGLTWYSDPACTTAVTTCENAQAEYYCVAGTEKLGAGIASVSTINCSLSITDSTGKSYVVGEGAYYDTVLTVNIIPDDGYSQVYIARINGTDFTSGDTITITSDIGDISIIAICYDGINIPINPTFSENSWLMIKEAFTSGIAKQFWNVGDTKEVTLTDGYTYHIRIADMTDGRYTKADGSGSTRGVFEFVELLPTSYAINPSQVTDGGSTCYTAGGWAMSYMKNTVMDVTVWNMLPDDLKQAISEITLNEYSYTSPSPRSSDNKLFLPAETEVFASRHNSAEGYQSGCVKYTQWEYYDAITTADSSSCPERQKQKVNSTSNNTWWLRSPYSGGTNSFCFVSDSGYYSNSAAYYYYGVSPCFAI